MTIQRREIEVTGIVQSVGFRPFVYQLAKKYDLVGSVYNVGGNVYIDVFGRDQNIESFIEQLKINPPKLSKISSLSEKSAPVIDMPHDFIIKKSLIDKDVDIYISPDQGVCEDCLKEFNDCNDRRYLYPFINCTNCGPRLSIIKDYPYDRDKTTMAPFKMCLDCKSEYENPLDRRYHAQPIACYECGPKLKLLNEKLEEIKSENSVQSFANDIQNNKIGLLKGIGGFHLVCRADDEKTITRLRSLKQRDEKPLALMFSDLKEVRKYCELSEQEMIQLTSQKAPIVLLKSKKQFSEKLAGKNNPYIGAMLAYSPLHHLLLKYLARTPLVMTSANLSNLPMIYKDEQMSSLLGVFDVALTHEREIHRRCDDAVIKNDKMIRLGRGYAPFNMKLPFKLKTPMLALGGQFKNIFALAIDERVIFSHHIGDLDEYSNHQALISSIDDFVKIFEIDPLVIVRDLHPNYATTQIASSLAKKLNAKVIPVQHHHAHLASVMLENKITDKVIGVCWDGTGFGLDKTSWGSEFFVGDLNHFQRVAHFKSVILPGDDLAAKEPWRMAYAYMRDNGLSKHRQKDHQKLDPFYSLFKNKTTSCGRLFDAVASITGLRHVNTFDGQAPIELEWSIQGDSLERYEFEVEKRDNKQIIVFNKMINSIVADVEKGVSVGVISQMFHNTLCEIIKTQCLKLRDEFKINKVCLSGGCFMNDYLSNNTTQALEALDFEVYQHSTLACHDGGLALGQIALANFKL